MRDLEPTPSEVPEVEQALGRNKKIGLVAHDNKKADLIEWATFNRHLIPRPRRRSAG